MTFSLELHCLRNRYLDGSLTPRGMVDALEETMRQPDSALVSLLTAADFDILRQAAERLTHVRPQSLPLYGIPFLFDAPRAAGGGAKNTRGANASGALDHVGVLARLQRAGALALPVPAVSGASPLAAAMVSRGLASFALAGGDSETLLQQAGDANLVGLWPSRGLLPSSGIVIGGGSGAAHGSAPVPLVIMALTADNAARVLVAAQGEEEDDPFSRAVQPHGFNFGRARKFCFGVPREDRLSWFGAAEEMRDYRLAVARLVAMGGSPVAFDPAPLLAAPSAGAPVSLDSLRQQRELDKCMDRLWQQVDVVLVPPLPAAQPRLPASKQHAPRPEGLPDRIDLCAIAVPSGGAIAPAAGAGHAGVVLAAPPFQEGPLLELAARLQAMAGGALGATRHPLPPDAALIAPSFESQAAPLFVSGQVLVAVSGPQMSGLPQNASLVRLGARQLRTLRSAPNYKLYRLSGPAPARCALVKVDPRRGGASIEVELWEMPLKTFGVWVAGIPAPYAIGTIVLDDGSTAHGVLCESHALLDARDISSHGGWRAYIESQVDVRLEATA